MSTVHMPLPCEALLDQGRIIGGDPVGHRCYNAAQIAFSANNGVTYRVCGECYTRLCHHDPRATLPPTSMTDEEIVTFVRELFRFREPVVIRYSDLPSPEATEEARRAAEEFCRKHPKPVLGDLSATINAQLDSLDKTIRTEMGKHWPEFVVNEAMGPEPTLQLPADTPTIKEPPQSWPAIGASSTSKPTGCTRRPNHPPSSPIG